MIKYKIILSEQGKAIFKGGNIKPMNKVLISFECDNLIRAKKFFDKTIIETLGSGSFSAFQFVEVD